MPSTPESVRGRLFELSRVYARAVDGRDATRFVGVFDPDATLRISAVGDPATVVRTIRGHGELVRVPAALDRFERTFHLLGQAGYERDGDRATGEVYCVAHHLTVHDDRAEDMVMYIRYADEYRADRAGLWRIVDRLLQVDWTETRPADRPPARG
jgi:SnoaL-like domain